MNLQKLVEHIPKELFPVDLIFFDLNNHLQPIQQTLFNALINKAKHYVDEIKKKMQQSEIQKKGNNEEDNKGDNNKKKKLSKEELDEKKKHFEEKFLEEVLVEEDDDLFSLSKQLPSFNREKAEQLSKFYAQERLKREGYVTKGRAIAFIRALFLICGISFKDLSHISATNNRYNKKSFHNSQRDKNSTRKVVW